jgi:hypothetical protein
VTVTEKDRHLGHRRVRCLTSPPGSRFVHHVYNGVHQAASSLADFVNHL